MDDLNQYWAAYSAAVTCGYVYIENMFFFILLLCLINVRAAFPICVCVAYVITAAVFKMYSPASLPLDDTLLLFPPSPKHTDQWTVREKGVAGRGESESSEKIFGKRGQIWAQLI